MKVKLLRGGLRDESVSEYTFGFTVFANPAIEKQLPCNDLLALTTRLPCDCWTTLATQQTSRRESQRWRNIFRVMLEEIGRFGLIIHWGESLDDFALAGPEMRPLLSADCLVGIQRDTLYEVSWT